MKRFYKETAVEKAEDGWRVLLDGKPMRTPAKSVLVVPNEALARAIAAEWAAVPEGGELNVSHLALTRFAATGLDRVPDQRDKVVEDTTKYGASDLLCYRATDPESLVSRQHESWQPLLDWARDRHGAELAVASGLTFVSQPNAALARLRRAVEAHSDLGLSALYNLTHISGSLVIALAMSEGRLSADEAFKAAQLDELYQIEKWGEDPIATQRHEGIAKDLEAGARFLALLGDARLKG
jgi:chaperone required for assembly of F1-ATPase